MRPTITAPSYLPADAAAWAQAHRELLERIVECLLETGRWPETRALSRRFAREGDPVDVRAIGSQMPRPLGFVDHNPERIVLLLYGLRMTHSGQRLLAGFTAMLRVAVERFAGDDEPPMLTRADAARGTVANDPYVTALSEIMLREAPFLGGSGQGGADDDWTREITADVTRYWGAVRADDYLQARAQELAGSPHLGWASAAVAAAHDEVNAAGDLAEAQRGDRRDVFISHAGEDKAQVARPLAHELRRLGYSVWLDERELVVGDSLSESIDWGLAHSEAGVVVLSRAFFDKPWPRRELRGLVAREMAEQRSVILPVWHGVDHAFLANKAPSLADLVAADTTAGIPRAADKIDQALQRRTRPALQVSRQPGHGVTADVSGQPPEPTALRGELVQLLRAQDSIGIEELLRAERRAFERDLSQLFAEFGEELDDRVDHARLGDMESSVWSRVERRLATLLALVQYAPERLVEEARTLAAAADRMPPTRSRRPVWREAMRWPVWMVVYTTGGLAVAAERWGVISALWQAQTGDGRPLAVLTLRNADRLAIEAARSRPNLLISSRAVWLWHLAFRSAGSRLLDEHYPELLSGTTDDPVGAFVSRLGNFSWLITALAGRADVSVDQYWRATQMDLTLPAEFGMGDAKVAAAAGVLFDTDAWTVGTTVGEWVERAHGRAGWS